MIPFVIGITGGSGSGKTSFARKLKEILEPYASLIALDNYYLPIDNQPVDKNGRPNFDLPESLNLNKFNFDLEELLKGNNITIKEYTFNVVNVPSVTLEIESKPIIIVEGLFIFHTKELYRKYDLKLFIEVDEEIRLQRRLVRDIKLRGYKEEDVLYCQENHVLPTYNMHISSLKNKVDMIILNNKNFNVSADIIADYLKSKI